MSHDFHREFYIKDDGLVMVCNYKIHGGPDLNNRVFVVSNHKKNAMFNEGIYMNETVDNSNQKLLIGMNAVSTR